MKSPAESLLVSLVQTNLIWEDPGANLSMLESKIMSSSDKMEVVILPEMFSTGFSLNAVHLAETMDGRAVQWMRKISAEKKIILAGSLIIEEDGKYHNRMIWMQPNGQFYFYDKRHLFAYAGEDEKFTGGTKRLIVSVKGWKINLQVCYDLRFPVWARQQLPIDITGSVDTEPEYDVLIYSANWPEKRSHAWRTLLQARAIENQSFVVGVNRLGDDGNNIHYTGDSMIVDALGEVLYSAGEKDEIFTYSLTLENLTKIRSKLPFLKDADPFLIGVPKQM
jgi:predicted amidohydrolase